LLLIRTITVKAVYSRGTGVFGSLGHGDLQDAQKYSKIKVDLDSLKATNISSGWGHSVLGSESGLVVWGRPYDFLSLLRIYRLYRSFFPVLGRWVSGFTAYFGGDGGLFTEPRMLSDLHVTHVSASAGLTMFLTASGEIYSFGLNRWGQCGINSLDLHIFSPNKVNLPPISCIDTGLQHCICASRDGEVYTWGKGERGQLGDGSLENIPNPVKIALPSRATQVSAGFAHSAALLDDGALYVWGKGLSLTPKDSMSGIIRYYEDQTTPRRVDLPDGRRIAQVASSNFNIVILAEDGTLWAMGMGEHDRDMSCQPLPVYVYDPDWLASGREPSTERVRLSRRLRLQKGYRRVCLFQTDRNDDNGSSSSSTSSGGCPADESLLLVTPPVAHIEAGEGAGTGHSAGAVRGAESAKLPPYSAFEVVLHNDEASVQPVDLAGLPVGAKLLELSVGWIHSLALVEEN